MDIWHEQTTNMNDGREYKYQRDWSVGSQMFHVRCDNWDEFKEAVDNIKTMLQPKSFPDDEGTKATPVENTVPEGPTCGIHNIPMILKPAGVSKAGRQYPAFWSCPDKTNGQFCSFRNK